ncbi:hypothetical protein J6590_042195 [Homalodisca vitripennis]|nr:hypothetical protein J6590_042195 [Homalodisca vitripennis]
MVKCTESHPSNEEGKSYRFNLISISVIDANMSDTVKALNLQHFSCIFPKLSKSRSSKESDGTDKNLNVGQDSNLCYPKSDVLDHSATGTPFRNSTDYSLTCPGYPVTPGPRHRPYNMWLTLADNIYLTLPDNIYLTLGYNITKTRGALYQEFDTSTVDSAALSGLYHYAELSVREEVRVEEGGEGWVGYDELMPRQPLVLQYHEIIYINNLLSLSCGEERKEEGEVMPRQPLVLQYHEIIYINNLLSLSCLEPKILSHSCCYNDEVVRSGRKRGRMWSRDGRQCCKHNRSTMLADVANLQSYPCRLQFTIKQRRAWLLLGWVTAERSCPCKQFACPDIGGGSEVTFKPLVPRLSVREGFLAPTSPGELLPGNVRILENCKLFLKKRSSSVATQQECINLAAPSTTSVYRPLQLGGARCYRSALFIAHPSACPI